jgi:hypothetical protein
MPTNGYDIAFEQAVEERAEIRATLEQLQTRGQMIDQLLQCLAPFVSIHEPFEDAASKPPSETEQAGEVHAQEIPVHQEG